MPTFDGQALQKEREDKLITILKDRLQPYVEGQVNEFVEWATSEARHLSQAGITIFPPRLIVYFNILVFLIESLTMYYVF